MAVITEKQVKLQAKNNKTNFKMSIDDIITPSARDYLSNNKIDLVVCDSGDAFSYKNGYVCVVTGKKMDEKPENMTHLSGNNLVIKTHPSIIFRGQLDKLGAHIMHECIILAGENRLKQKDDLYELGRVIQEILKCHVIGIDYLFKGLWGMTPDELRDHTHNTMNHYNTPHIPADCYMDLNISRLNILRAMIREVEISHLRSIKNEKENTYPNIILALNRLSSAIYIMMLRCYSGFYG